MTDAQPRTPNADQLAAYVGRTDTDDADGYVAECLAEAVGMVDDHIGTANQAAVSDWRHYRAVLEVAAELVYRRQARGGIAMFTNGENPAPVRLARDPMRAAYDILAPVLPGGFA